MITKKLKKLVKFVPVSIQDMLEKIYVGIRCFKKLLKKAYLSFRIKRAQNRYQKLIKGVSQKKKLNVAFLLLNADTWKYDELYKEFEKSEIYHPFIIVCPITSKGENYLIQDYNRSIELCEKMNYEYYKGYDLDNSKIVDIKNILKPDIVFFTNPNNLSFKYFSLSNFKDVLTCYVPYSYRIDTLYEYGYNKEFLNLTWRNFFETNIHKELSERYAINKGNNVVVTGFPKLDELKKISVQNEIWYNNQKKKIIWAPHWAIKGYQNSGLDWSCFLDYHEIFFEFAEKYFSKIEIALKPHPFLFTLLEEEALWGKEKTNQFINKWKSNKNTHIVQGDYAELFASSDALIHDSGSFLVEYLVFNNPVAYTISKSSNIDERFNKIGKLAIEEHYKIFNESELENFIKNVITDYDPLERSRSTFSKNYIEINGASASENILNELNKDLA